MKFIAIMILCLSQSVVSLADDCTKLRKKARILSSASYQQLQDRQKQFKLGIENVIVEKLYRSDLDKLLPVQDSKKRAHEVRQKLQHVVTQIDERFQCRALYPKLADTQIECVVRYGRRKTTLGLGASQACDHTKKCVKLSSADDSKTIVRTTYPFLNLKTYRSLLIDLENHSRKITDEVVQAYFFNRQHGSSSSYLSQFKQNKYYSPHFRNELSETFMRAEGEQLCLKNKN